jgi:hypothetical protein
VILTRVLAVLAAVTLVGAFAMATLLPQDMTLGQGLAELDPEILDGLRDGLAGHGAAWVWSGLVMPLLLRPLWLVPTSLGLVFAGGAMTLGSRKGVTRSHRRRS